MAPRRDPVVDQLPQARRTSDGYPSGDLQPGIQHKQAACGGAARPAPKSVAPAVGVTSLPGSDRPPFSIVAASNVGLRSVLCDDSNADMNEEYADIDEAEAKMKAVEALLTLQRLKFSGRLSCRQGSDRAS